MVLKKINFARLFFIGILATSLTSVVSCESGSLENGDTEFTNGPSAFFTTTISGDDSLTANFMTASSLDAVSYLWDFGDGVGTSPDANPEYVYSENGDYIVTLTSVDSDGVETVSRQVISAISAEVTDSGGGTPVVSETNQFAFITDTSDADTGELRLELDAIPQGMMTVTVNKEMMSGQDAFINLSGSSTTRSNAMIDMRVSDGGFSFTESGANVAATFPEFINGESYDIVITWDATVTGTAPLVDVSINGTSVTAAPFPTEAGLNNSDATRNDPSSVLGGVEVVQFRFGGGSAMEAAAIGLLIDDLNVFDTSSGSPTLVFEDDFESYSVGDSLDPNADTASNGPIVGAIIAMDTPYDDASFQTSIGVIESTTTTPEPVSSNQSCFITDSSEADTGELRLEIDAVPQGMMTISINKEMMSGQDAFVNLSGSSTTRSNAMIDMRVSDGGFSFTESGANVGATFPEFINGETYDIAITWDATVTGSAPLVDVSINGTSVTAAPFPTEAGLNNSDATRNDPSSVLGGVEVVQFRFGGGSAIEDVALGLLIDDLNVFDTSSGSPVLVFEDDFESYSVGDSLDPNADTASSGPIVGAIIAMDTPYDDASFQATVVED